MTRRCRVDMPSAILELFGWMSPLIHEQSCGTAVPFAHWLKSVAVEAALAPPAKKGIQTRDSSVATNNASERLNVRGKVGSTDTITTPLPIRTDGAEVGFTSGSPRPPAHGRAEVTEYVGRGSKPPRATTVPGGVAHGAGGDALRSIPCATVWTGIGRLHPEKGSERLFLLVNSDEPDCMTIRRPVAASTESLHR